MALNFHNGLHRPFITCKKKPAKGFYANKNAVTKINLVYSYFP